MNKYIVTNLLNTETMWTILEIGAIIMALIVFGAMIWMIVCEDANQ